MLNCNGKEWIPIHKSEQHQIVPITKDNIAEAIAIRSECYLQDYIDVLPESSIENYRYETDLEAIQSWYLEGVEDYRTGFLYKIDHRPVGMVMGSLADLGNAMDSVELNYLFVSQSARGQGVGQKLMVAMAITYYSLGLKSLCLYNWRALKSNAFYRHLDPDQIETIIQHPGGKALETDIFHWQIERLLTLQSIDKIFWFSGTGGTQYIAEQLKQQLLHKGKLALSLSMGESLEAHYEAVLDQAKVPADRIFVLFPVYAMAEPRFVKQWAEQLPNGHSAQTIVLSVSGGGEVWPNTSCRRKVIRLLTDKGYQVIYERMLVMPPNLLLEAEADLVRYLLRAVPEKLKDMLHELDQGKQRRTRIKLSTVWMRFLAEAEQHEAAKGAKHFSVSDACTRCGHCIEQCPVNNLYWDFNTRIPAYRNDCQLCLRCYYNCPAHAIHAPKLERWLLGCYNIDQMKRLASQMPEKSIDECCKGLLWIGVKRYLKEIWE